MAWRPAIKKAFTPEQFRTYVSGVTGMAWKPEWIVVHNTAVPSLAQRPAGFLSKHIDALEHYYKNDRGWSSGPHLFIDDHFIWVFSPLTHPGTHSPSWNSRAIGIEMLGDYAKESFTEGRGASVRRNTAAAIAAISMKFGFEPDAWRWHVQDPKTTHDCPGKLARAQRALLVTETREFMDLPPAWDKPAPDRDFK